VFILCTGGVPLTIQKEIDISPFDGSSTSYVRFTAKTWSENMHLLFFAKYLFTDSTLCAGALS
jgi:hypothetical protein